ncbi:MAG: amidohydrolase family protein [Nitriliruptoraceae bacterium]
MTGLLLRHVYGDHGRVVDVRTRGALIVEVGVDLAVAGERMVEGGYLLPGLHDHHLHLLATAATADAVPCGPPDVREVDGLAAALRTAAAGRPAGEWLRGVGYHESVAGMLSREVIDTWIPDRPVRIQHRSGALWMVNSAGLAALRVAEGELPTGVELDAQGHPTGRLWRVDPWLRDRLGPQPGPDLAPLGRRLAGCGVTGVTDATPDLDDRALGMLIAAVAGGEIPQRVHLLGVDRLPEDLPTPVRDRITVGPRKVVLPDHDLPALDELIARLRDIRATRPGGRAVAVHCVTRTALVLLCAALDEVGAVPGDRIEHASVVPAELLPTLRRLGVTVVTQPGLVAARGDDYLREVDPDDVPGLYRHASLLSSGIPVGLSTDAPYTAPDPWHAVDAAVERRTPSGRTLGPSERVTRQEAMDGFATPAADPGGRPRRLAPGQPADLCLLEVPPTAGAPPVMLTVVGGDIIHDRAARAR